MGISFKVSKTGKRYRPKPSFVPEETEPLTESSKESSHVLARAGSQPEVDVTDAAFGNDNILPEHEVSFTLNLYQKGYYIGKPTEIEHCQVVLQDAKSLHPYDRASETLFSGRSVRRRKKKMETPWTSWFSESEMSMNESCSFLHQWETATRNNQDMAPVLAPAAAGVGFSASLSSESQSHTSRSFHHQHHPMAPAGGAAQAACCVAESSKAQEIIMISWNLSSNGKADHPADGGSFSSPSAAPLTAVPTYGEGRAATKEKEEAGASAPGAPLQKHETFVQRATLSPAQEHIMAERNRREKINQKFIALSAIIPGLKKADKASVLGDAVRYVKELEERVKALEDQNMSRTVESVILVNKSHISAGHGDCDGDGDGSSSSSDESSDHGQPSQKPFPEIEAKICGKTALFSIHCESRKGVVVKILSEIENLNLSITSTNVMPFLGSSINITVTAQIEDEVPVTAADLVRKLKSVFN